MRELKEVMSIGLGKHYEPEQRLITRRGISLKQEEKRPCPNDTGRCSDKTLFSKYWRE